MKVKIFYFKNIVNGNLNYNQINNPNFQIMNIRLDDNNNFLYNNNYKIRKRIRPFTERTGDWFCSFCKNLNFAFRVVCNRCHLSKAESEKNNEKESKNNESKDSNFLCVNETKKENEL